MQYVMKIMGLLLLMAVLETGCKKETDCDDPTNMECSNYDPCYGQTALTGAFTMEEQINRGFITEPYRSTYPNISAEVQDTVMKYNFIVFKAQEEADRYEWTIGSDPRVFTGKEFRLRFSNVEPTPATLPITLRVFRDESQSCFPRDTFAQVVQTITFVDHTETMLKGEYRGISTYAPEDSITIRIYREFIPGGGGLRLIDGLLFDCNYTGDGLSGAPGYNVLGGYYKAIFEQNDLFTMPDHINCYSVQGIIELAENRSDIRIQYFLKMNGRLEELNEEFVFTGKRIN